MYNCKASDMILVETTLFPPGEQRVHARHWLHNSANETAPTCFEAQVAVDQPEQQFGRVTTCGRTIFVSGNWPKSDSNLKIFM